jgi:putative SOS response-associated peptidase YedK
MCGRFNLFADAESVQAAFELAETPRLYPRYNIAPTQPVAAIRWDSGRNRRELTYLHWGLIPSWSKDTKWASRLINARSETAHEKPSFRSAFRRRRCLVPATGFYEWQRTADGKQPFVIGVGENELFAIAGLWEHWMGPDGSEIESCTLLTTEPNALLEPIHNRMPVILPRDEYELWLDPNAPLPAVHAVLRPYSAQQMRAYPISKRVNRPSNDDASLIEPIAA